MPQISIADVRQKYPQYDDMSDAELADRLYQRFYSDMPRAEYDQRIGLAQPQAMEPQAQATEQAPLGSTPDAQAAQPMSMGEDVVRSFGAGVRSGLEGLVALPGDLSNLAATQISALAKRLGANEQTADLLGKALTRVTPMGPPTSETVQGATNALMGDALRHEPQTTAGEYARTAGEFLPGAAVPGGIVARTAAVAVPAGVSETAGQLTEGTPYEGLARFLGAVAGGSAVGTAQGAGALRAATKADRAQKVNTALAEAAEFGVPLTRGQASGDLKALTAEENLRQMPGIAQRPMRQFDEAQQAAIGQYTDQMAARFGRSAGDAAEVVPEGVRRIAASLEAKGNALYDKAFESGLMVHKEALDNLPAFINNRLVQEGRIVDEMLTPAASRALREVDEAIKTAGALQPRAPSPDGLTASSGGQIAGINLKGLHQIRRRINNLKGVNPDDWATLGQVKRAFDDWIDDAVDHFLYSGDDAALEAYREATKTWKDFRAITHPRAGDNAGKIISKMLSDDAHANEVANWLYGANIARPNTNAPRVAKRLKTLLGDTSTEWAAIRAGAWDRLTRASRDEEILSPTKMANNIEDFVNGSGKSLARELFSAEERGTMRRLANTLRRTVTPRDATNAPRSGYTTAALMRGFGNAILGSIGATTHGITGGLAGFIALPVMRGVKDLRTLRKATSVSPQSVPVVKEVNAAIPAANALAIGAANNLPMLTGGANALPAQ